MCHVSNSNLKITAKSDLPKGQLLLRGYVRFMVNQKRHQALQIRWAKEDDIRDLVFVENECFHSHYREHRFNEAEFIDYLRKKQRIFLVAILNSSVVGYVAGSLGTSRSQSSASLDSIAVLPTSRGKGVGERLMKRFIEEAKRGACKRIMLEVAVVNESGILFFSKQGFQKIRRLPAYYGEALDGVLMKLEISPTTR